MGKGGRADCTEIHWTTDKAAVMIYIRDVNSSKSRVRVCMNFVDGRNCFFG